MHAGPKGSGGPLMSHRHPFCVTHHDWHAPTHDCVPCRFCGPGFIHEDFGPSFHVDRRGWRFTPPFICMTCGIQICPLQWIFSSICGSCDCGHSKTVRLFNGKCFAGPHELIDVNHKDLIPEGHFVSATDREKYPTIALRHMWPVHPKGFPQRPPWRGVTA